MFELKTYQQETLQALREFLEEARLMPVEEAFARAQQRQNRQPLPYLHHAFGQVPYVCLRLPTGGSKTVLASYAVGLAKRAYLEQDYPIVLWLVPTNTIREQTLEAPDFIVERHDGRTVVVEYKGEHLQTADDAREKAAVGQQWAHQSGGLFLLALAKDAQGKNLYQQLNQLFT